MPRRLLVAHFLRRLLDNDLVAPGTDRHQALSVTVAALVSLGAFLTVALSIKYLFSPIQSPGETALVALDDVGLMSGLSMIVMALVAVSEWQALSLDVRDTAILGPLPVPARELALAQLAALTLFAGAFSATLNGAPSVLMPLLRLSRLGVDATTIARLMAAQAVAATAAGVLGFALVVALREGLRALTGRRFASVAGVTQAALVVTIAMALLALPVVSTHVARRWVAPASTSLMPPAWFAGLYDRLGGDRLERMPPTLPPRDAPAFDSILRFEQDEAARYSRARPRLAALAGTGLLATAATLAVALLAWGWNARRLPQAAPAPVQQRRGTWTAGIETVFARRPVTRAGLRFTFQTLARSAPHRIVIAAAFGIAVALGTVTLRTLARGPVAGIGQVPLAVLASQLIVVTAVVVGMRQACRIPAFPAATPSFTLAWYGGGSAFAAGVRRAVLLSCAAAVLVMAPVAGYVLGPRLAVWHAAFGLLSAGIGTSLLFARVGRVPLVSTFESAGNVLGLAPIYLVIGLAVVFGAAWVEREALGDEASTLLLAIVLILVWAGLVLARRRLAPSEDLTAAEVPAWETQHLGLTE